MRDRGKFHWWGVELMREREKKKTGEREKDEDRTAMRKEREIRAGRN